MNSKQMINWSRVFLLISALILVWLGFTGEYHAEVFYFLVVSVIFNVGSSIMKKLEAMNNEL